MKLKLILIAAACLFMLLASNSEAQQKQKNSSQKQSKTKTNSIQIEYLTGEKARQLPFSEAVKVGNMLYLSGQLGLDENATLVQGGIKAETKQVMENIKRVLEKNGSSLNNVVKCTVMLADISEFGAMNEVYSTYFPKDRLPARSTFGANGLVRGAKIEIECIAVVK